MNHIGYCLTPRITYIQGDYDKAVQYFGRCYELSTQMGDQEVITSCRVQYGIAKGNNMLAGFSKLLGDHSHDSLEGLVAWKGSRLLNESGQLENPVVASNVQEIQKQGSL